MPTGKAIFRSGTESPVSTLKFSMKKSAYLQYVSKPMFATTERKNAIFEIFVLKKRSMTSVATYDCVTDTSINTRNLGSPQKRLDKRRTRFFMRLGAAKYMSRVHGKKRYRKVILENSIASFM